MKLRCFSIRILLVFAVLTASMSCTSYKKITYFKNISDSSEIYLKGEEIKTASYKPLTIQPDDNLQVLISTIDPQANEALNLSTSATSNVSDNKNVNGSTADDVEGYLVDKKGDIEIPVIGTIKVGGLTTDEIKRVITNKAITLFQHPVVNVRLSNFKVTVLGEVAKPGTYTFNRERVNVLDALGLAGDMTIYGKRENVLLMRMENGDKKLVARFDLNDAKMLSSPYFYLRQGDILYIEPVKGKAAATDMSATKTYTILGTVLSVIIVIVSRL